MIIRIYKNDNVIKEYKFKHARAYICSDGIIWFDKNKKDIYVEIVIDGKEVK